jgi:hypothetical protein
LRRSGSRYQQDLTDPPKIYGTVEIVFGLSKLIFYVVIAIVLVLINAGGEYHGCFTLRQFTNVW